MKRWRNALLAAAAVTVLTGLNGCYTMLIHPSIREADEDSGTQYERNIAHTERCTDCHTGEVHGQGHASRGYRSGVYGDRYDYDPFWSYGSYYDPWFWGSASYSPYFYDSYYGYRSVPWWLYNIPGNDGTSSEETAPSAKEKPARRGEIGSDSNRRDITPLPSVPRSNTGGAERPASGSSGSSGSNGSSGGSGSDKEKPARRGGVK
jgi:uncharacterized membrane protein YgcG